MVLLLQAVELKRGEWLWGGVGGVCVSVVCSKWAEWKLNISHTIYQQERSKLYISCDVLTSRLLYITAPLPWWCWSRFKSYPFRRSMGQNLASGTNRGQFPKFLSYIERTQRKYLRARRSRVCGTRVPRSKERQRNRMAARFFRATCILQ